MPEVPVSAEKLDRLQNRPEIVGRLPHPHKIHFPDAGIDPAGCGHLSRDLSASKLPDESRASRHAERTAHRASDLCRHADTVLRENDRFHGLSVPKLHQKFF